MRAYHGASPSDAAPCAPSCRGPGPPSCVAVLVPHQRHHRLLLLLRLRHRLRFSREAARRRRPASTSGDAAKGLPGDGRDEEGSIVAEARASPNIRGPESRHGRSEASRSLSSPRRPLLRGSEGVRSADRPPVGPRRRGRRRATTRAHACGGAGGLASVGEN